MTDATGPNTITLYAAKGDAFWPIATVNVSSLIEQGYDQRFMLAWNGHIDQLVVDAPSACTSSTPQAREPEHPCNRCGYGGKPGLAGRREVETITACFKTEQS